ncbi:serine hydrolase domain-containing protein [Sporosalibacterium faouarense]|uniref:serine hydrolase domain-containing protein n=1 Tax=Sporosalibacterium faouarense TaxID=516123 RepID=UPI00141C4138|nr:serine hydrolase [Sporosalibacterium faouarense]MTI47266.1 serine hydrolase [Bacillota bacterium]
MSDEWQFSKPEDENMNSEILGNIDNYLKQKRYRLVNSILVIKNEKIVFEKYYKKFNKHSRNNIKSIWKSILSIVTGICLDQGVIKSLDEPIYKYLEEFSHNNHIYHKAITIRNLLTMTSGIYWNNGIHYNCPMMTQMMKEDNWLEYLSDIAVKDFPGSKFTYKEWDVILLSALINRASGRTTYEICNKFLYKPLNIKSGDWSLSPDNVSYTIMEGEENSDLSARDLGKIGILLLNNGIYKDNRIVSEEYLRQATKSSPKNLEYGYLFWVSNMGYSCRGFGGQEINIYPEHKTITVIQATPTPLSKEYSDINEEIIKSITCS